MGIIASEMNTEETPNNIHSPTEARFKAESVSIPSIIQFYRLCYQSDNRDFTLWNASQLIEDFSISEHKSSIGVLSPYRDHMHYLRQQIEKDIPISQQRAHQLRVDTPFGFQGDERDYMLISPGAG